MQERSNVYFSCKFFFSTFNHFLKISILIDEIILHSTEFVSKLILNRIFSKKHKKHKKPKKEKDAVENGTMDEKLPSKPVEKETEVNGKLKNSTEVVDTEESEEEKLVDLDSDEVDCTIIEDDIDLEELMKQKVDECISINI